MQASVFVVLALIALGHLVECHSSGLKERTCGVRLVERVRDLCHSVSEKTCIGIPASRTLQASLRSAGKEAHENLLGPRKTRFGSPNPKHSETVEA